MTTLPADTPTACDDDAPPRLSGPALWMQQTAALMLDAYRELNSRALFWIVLALSGLVAGTFALVGYGPGGVTVLGWNVTPFPNSDTVSAADFYKQMFITAGVGFWITWAATILALISTAGIIPDLISGGSVDLYLSKPMGRARLFLTKYVMGLLFVALQITVFCAASFLVIGLRGGAWAPSIFLAVPVVTLYYSFLFCIAALIGLITGSTLTAVLLTLLIWFGIFLLNLADGSLLTFKTTWALDVQGFESRIERNEAKLQGFADNPATAPGAVFQDAVRLNVDKDREVLTERRSQLEQFEFWHNLVLATKAPLPKTGESIDILERWLIDSPDLAPTEMASVNEPLTPSEEERRGRRRDGPPGPMGAMDSPEVEQNVEASLLNRGPLWAFGTSLGFEAVVLGLAVWRFSRRDF